MSANLHPIFLEALKGFMPPAQHTTKRASNGTGIGDYTRAVCACGWQGPKRYGYEDYQHTSLRDDERGHLESKGRI